MKVLEKHPMVMIVIGVIGISLSAIFVKYSDAPSVVTAAYRLLWTVGLMTPVVFGKARIREELKQTDGKTIALCAVSGIFLALHFTAWFESLKQTSVASSTAIVCTEVIWVALGFVVFLKGRIGKAALMSIAITVLGSLLIALSDYSAGGDHLSGDGLALAAAIFSAVYTLIGREVRKGMSTTSYTYIVYFFLCIGALHIYGSRRNSFPWIWD
uniref:DMT family transporter n=1 Tax=Clostridium sp. NkU-1 TaxID=1095009 RepID=UPI000B10A562